LKGELTRVGRVQNQNFLEREEGKNFPRGESPNNLTASLLGLKKWLVHHAGPGKRGP